MFQYFTEGIAHITDFEGYDHMLYLAALCAPFTLKDWKPVVLLATAFTIGHSLALFLAAIDIIRFQSSLIETLIPATIMATALITLLRSRAQVKTGITAYVITISFGLIHGMGFSSYFRMIADESGKFITSLLLFNLGVEAGQLIIVLVLLAAATLITAVFKIVHVKKYAAALSIVVFLVASWLLYDKITGA